MRTKNRQPRVPCANPDPGAGGGPQRFSGPGSPLVPPIPLTSPVCKAPALFRFPTLSRQTRQGQGSRTRGPGSRWARAPSTGPGLVRVQKCQEVQLV